MRAHAAVALLGVLAALFGVASAKERTPSESLIAPPARKLTLAAAHAEADRRISKFANEHAHEQCGAQEQAVALLSAEAAADPSKRSPDWRLVVARSELDLERCYRESMAGLAAFIGKRYLLGLWGFADQPEPR